MPSRRLLPITLAVVATALVATPAYAYQTEVPSDWQKPAMGRVWTTADTIPCFICHGTGESVAKPPTEDSGPHGVYITTTTKCVACHSVHVAVSPLLLPAMTVKDTCETCHDGTGGSGVYGELASKIPAVVVASDHSIDMTKVVPGGDAGTGGSATRSFSGVSLNLTCSDCHSPHGTNVVDAFTGDRARSGDLLTVTSTRILKQIPTSGTAAVTKYGSDWCGSCHSGRLSGSGSYGNHPVESAVTQPDPAVRFNYNKVAVVSGARSTTTIADQPLGHTNNGYVMPDPRTAQQGAHPPICQQCHEDARHVGDNAAYPQQIDTNETFTVTGADGAVTTDNPRFQVFPHESQNAFFLIETDDDLCLNCHGQLP